MLVLSRKENERIVLSNGVAIEVKEIRGTIVRIGVEAPPAVRILRDELANGDAEFGDMLRRHGVNYS